MRVGPSDPLGHFFKVPEVSPGGVKPELPAHSGAVERMDVSASLRRMDKVPKAVSDLIKIIGHDPTAMDMLGLAMGVSNKKVSDVAYHLLKDMFKEGR